MVAPFTEGGRHPKTQARVRLFNVFSPARLFANGEEGAWYDPSDLSTLYQDSAGTTTVTADGDPVGRMEDKSGNGNHATQSTSAARPVYRTDGTLHWLEFDGVDDSLSFSNPLTGSSAHSVLSASSVGIIASSRTLGFGFGDASTSGARRSFTPEIAFRVQGGAETYDQGLSAGVPAVVSNLCQASGVVLDNRAFLNSIELGVLTDSTTVLNTVGVAVIGQDFSGSATFTPLNLYGGIVVDQQITEANRIASESYLAQKSGVTL